MIKEIDKKQCSIDLLHNKVKHLNKIDDTGLLEKKKIEEHEEVLEAIESTISAINHLNSELADKLITYRDVDEFDFRNIRARIMSSYGIFSLVSMLACEEEILKHCHKKVDRTIKRIESGYYKEKGN